MPTSGFTKAFVVEGAPIAPGTHVKKGTAERGIVVAGDNDEVLGITQGSDDTLPVIVGDHADVMLEGEGKVLLGATLTAGDSVNSDAAGKAKALPTTTGTKFSRSGILLESGVSGDMVDINVKVDFVTFP